jgi:hypothetical protein
VTASLDDVAEILLASILTVFYLNTVSYARPPKEDEFVKSYLKKEIRALAIDAELQRRLIAFAIEEAGAESGKLRPRLYHVLKGRTPSAYLALLIVRFFRERRYEKFVRTTKDYVEYLTSDGITQELENLVANHPLALRIVKVRMTNSVVTGKPNWVDIHLRTPVPPPDEAEAIEAAVNSFENDPVDKRMKDFKLWLEKQEYVPKTYLLKKGESIEIHYQPDWVHNVDEGDFESQSDFRGWRDVYHAVNILVYAELGRTSPSVHPDMLDTFHHLVDLFQGTEAQPAPLRHSFDLYWPRIIISRSNFAEIFFTHIEKYPASVRSKLEVFFKRFAKQHRNWVEKALNDSVEIEEQGEAYAPTPENVFHYNQVKETFFKQLRPVLKSCWPIFAKASLEVLEMERIRARKHFDKIRRFFM